MVSYKRNESVLSEFLRPFFVRALRKVFNNGERYTELLERFVPPPLSPVLLTSQEQTSYILVEKKKLSITGKGNPILQGNSYEINSKIIFFFST